MGVFFKRSNFRLKLEVFFYSTEYCVLSTASARVKFVQNKKGRVYITRPFCKMYIS
jgi:hypothetical protein